MHRSIQILVFRDFQLLDATGPIAAFEIASRIQPGYYRVSLVAPVEGPVTSSSGTRLVADALEISASPDTLIVAGGLGVAAAARSARMLGHIRTAADHVRRVASVCSGAFLLAAAGLLDGRRATTHWERTAQFRTLFPRVLLEPDRIFVRDGSVWTSAGISAGLDLALAMISEDLGEEVARRTARQLVIPYRRAGGQSQFSSFLEAQHPDGRFTPVLDWAREHLQEPLPVERLAQRAALSPRQFTRAFVRETGVTPAKAIERIRLDAARRRVEADTMSIGQVAEVSGFGDAERMRRAFLRTFGQPPQAFRRATGSR